MYSELTEMVDNSTFAFYDWNNFFVHRRAEGIESGAAYGQMS